MTAILRPNDFHTEQLLVNGLKMNVALEGDSGAPLIVLLHGFPEFWYSWRHQLKALASAGYRVVAPDQRGYNLTDKTGPYDMLTLSDDIAALIERLGYERASAVIGHDWGGVITWVFGARHAQLTERVIVCNVPHPLTMNKTLKEFYLPQITKSWYFGFFQIPELPERLLATNHYQSLIDQLCKDSHGKITVEEAEYFRSAWKQPGAITGGINWYRSMFKDREKLAKQNLRVRIPSLLIWGDQDRYLTTQMAEWSRNYAENMVLKYVPGVSHWVQQESPELVNRYILDFLKGQAL